MSELRIIGAKGDMKVEWNPDEVAEVEVARKVFEENTKKGFKAFSIKCGQQGKEMRKFNRYAQKILLIPPIAGG